MYGVFAMVSHKYSEQFVIILYAISILLIFFKL